MKKKTLEQIYWDVSHPGSLSGLENFYRVLKEKKIKINRQQVKEWLASQEAYTMHRRMLKKFPRNKVITRGIDDLWQIDLADMQNISKYNDNFRYLVTCIDVFSKFAWVIPIKNKQAKSVLEAFKIIIENSSRKPNNLQSDQGTEFLNKEFKEYLEEIDVGHYYVNSELKACVVERFSRTIKEKIYRYFTY
jgi:transposase InsO family protein